MKRLIVLVLSLVMALSLCAPAWGVGESTSLPEATVVNSTEYEKVDLPWGSYGQWSPTDGLDSQLEAAYTFSCTETAEEAANNAYANWYCDFYVSLDKDLGANQIFLGGNYGSFGWIGFHNGDVTLNANEELPLLGSVTNTPWTYADIASFVGEFICGVGDVDNALDGATFTVMLRLTNPEDETEFYNVATITHTFDNDDSAKCVAKIDSESYSSLQAAIDAAQPGQTVTLFSNVALTETVNVAKSITIDGNGHKFVNLGTTTNTAFMLGDSTWGEEKVAECNITLRNATFVGWETEHVVRVQGVTATIDNCTFENCGNSDVKYGLITLTYTEAAVQNCTFINNICSQAVNVNYNAADGVVLTKTNTIDNCVFTNNDISGAGVVYYADGGGFVCKNSEFTGNTVNAAGSSATLYLGFNPGCTVTGNLFKDNTITSAGTGGNIAGGLYVGNLANINGNAFVNNKATNAASSTLGQSLGTSVYYTEKEPIVLNGNYWDGKAPVVGADYVVGHQSSNPDGVWTLKTYYTSYSVDANGNVVLSGLVDPNAPKPPVYNPTVTPETPTEKPVETPTETPTQTPTQPAPSTEVTVGGSESAVKVEATVTGTTATIDKIDTAQMETAIDSAADTGKVTIDFSAVAAAPESGEENAVVDTVEIPVEVIAQIAEAVADPENKTESLEIVLGDGASIEFDAAALAEKVAQAGGESIEISIKPTTAVPERLSSAQLFAVGESVAYDITVTSGGVAVSDMGGNITITAPYALAEGETAEGIVVYYVDDEGNREKCETTYDAATGRVSWVTNHLSVYMVAYEAPAADDGATDDGAVSDTPVVDDAQSSGSPALWIIIVVVVIVAIVVVVIISKKRKA